MAKHKAMKKHSGAWLQIPTLVRQQLLQPPAYPRTGPELVRRLKELVEQAECGPGQALEQKEAAKILGVAKSTLHDWHEGKVPAAVRAMICGLERLSWEERERFLREFCRDCPRRDHPAIAFDPAGQRLVDELLEIPVGLSLITGDERSFVFHVFGNSARWSRPHRRVGGLNVQPPNMFAPVPGVFYSRMTVGPDQARELAVGLWPILKKAQYDVLLLNAPVLAMPKLLREVMRVARHRRVFVADTIPAGLSRFNANVVVAKKVSGESKQQYLSLKLLR